MPALPARIPEGPKGSGMDEQRQKSGDALRSAYCANRRAGTVGIRWRRSTQRAEASASYLRVRAIAPAMTCMVTPTTHAAMIMLVQAMCGS